MCKELPETAENPWCQLGSKDADPIGCHDLDTPIGSKGKERTTINLYCPGDQTNTTDMDTTPEHTWCCQCLLHLAYVLSMCVCGSA